MVARPSGDGAPCVCRRAGDQVANKLAVLVPPDADPEDVASAIISVVDARKGHRPFGVHIDPADDGAEVVRARGGVGNPTAW